MSKVPNEQLLEAYKKLPEDLQEAILSVNTSVIIQEIGAKYGLMVDKMGDLADETGLVMLGFTRPSQYISNLSERLGIDREKAKEIAEEINSRVFFPVRENLKKIHSVENEPPPPITKSDFVVTPKPPENLPVFSPAPPAPAIPDTMAASAPKNGIFETKTQEGIFRSPAAIVEKKAPTSPAIPPEGVGIDPYKEPTN